MNVMVALSNYHYYQGITSMIGFMQGLSTNCGVVHVHYGYENDRFTCDSESLRPYVVLFTDEV
jgi:hypothetical protein